VGQTLRQAQGDNSKDRYKLTVFLKVIFREEFSSNTLFMHYPENLHRIFGGIPVTLYTFYNEQLQNQQLKNLTRI